MAKVGRDEADRELARLIRRSRALGAVQKRHWLRVLPHLSPLDRLVSHRVPLERVADAFDLMQTGKSVRVVLDLNGSG